MSLTGGLSTGLTRGLTGGLSGYGGGSTPSVSPFPAGTLTAPVVAEMRAAARLFVGRTGSGTTATTNGTLVGSFIDSYGILWTATADGKRMTLNDLGSGKWELASSSLTTTGYNCDPSISLNGASFIAVQAWQTNTGASTRIVQDQGGANCVFAYSRPSNCVYVQADVRGAPIGTDENPHTLMLYKAAAGAWKIRKDDSDTNLATASVTNEWTQLAIGDSAARSETFVGGWSALCVAASETTLAERDVLRAYFGGLM